MKLNSAKIIDLGGEYMGFFAKLKNGLKKTRQGIAQKINAVFDSSDKIDENLYEELEEILIMADVGMETSVEIIDNLRENIKKKKIKHTQEARQELIEIIREILTGDENLKTGTTPSIILVLGVNGVGKTTTIGKLANILKNQGKEVIIGAADTFRAAAIDQLEIWAQRVGCAIVKHREGADPAAVVFDTVVAAKKRNVDVAICDTAGRLHNKKNLMAELKKISDVVKKEAWDLDIEILLVVDATTGQNGVVQAKEFGKASGLTGIILTKLDGTAKGGIVISIRKNLGLPIKFIGVGEQIDDLQPFDPELFTKALFDSDSSQEEI